MSKKTRKQGAKQPGQGDRKTAQPIPGQQKTGQQKTGQQKTGQQKTGQQKTERKKDSVVAESAPGWVRILIDNAEALAVALVMALLVKQFALEAFKIPSDSMYPTLNGELTNGDRVVVNKWAFVLGEPRRWDVTVFKYPLDITRNFIKRLVGMPGDRLTVVDGDIWINRKIERKPDRVQRSVWFERFPSVPGFIRRPAPCKFRLADDGWKGRDDHFTGEPPDDGVMRLDFDFGTPVSLDGDPTAATYNDVRDFRVRGSVSAVTGAVVGVEMTVRDIPFRVSLATGTGKSSVTFPRDAHPVTVVEEQGKDLALTADTAHDFEVAHWDWRFEVRVDGEVWFAYELNPHPWTLAGREKSWPEMYPVRRNTLRITAAGGRIAFEDLAVDQDLHYTQPRGGVWDTIHYRFKGELLRDGKIPAGHYFMMGDNSHGSRDSRLWHRIKVKDPATGEPFWGEEYSWALESERMHNEATVNFVDMMGNGYWIQGFDRHYPTNRTRSPAILDVEPFGLIPRRDLVGRALFIFWPFPPFTDTFRPKLIQ